MVTKSTKSRSYQTKWKAFAIVLFSLSAFAIFICGIVLANTSRYWSREILEVESMYDTEEFQRLFSSYLDHVVTSDVHYVSEENITNGKFVDRDELIENFKRYYGITDGIITSNTVINETFDGLYVTGNIPTSMEYNLEEYIYLVESRLPLYRLMYIQEQLDAYRASKRVLNNTQNFFFYVEDAEGTIINGNITRSDFNEMEKTIVLSSEFSSDNIASFSSFQYSNSLLAESDYWVYAGVRDDFVRGDEFYVLHQEYMFAKASLPILLSVFVTAALVVVGCLLYLLRVVGQREKDGLVHYLAVDRIHNEVHFMLVCVYFVFASAFAIRLLQYTLLETSVFWVYLFTTLLGLVYAVSVGIGLCYILSVARQIKGKTFFYNTWVSATIRKLSELFTGKTFRGWMIFVMLGYAIGNVALTFFALHSVANDNIQMFVFWILGVIAFNAFCMYLFLRALRSLKRIMIAARETSKGNLQYQLNLMEISPSFLNFATDIAHIQDGLKNAVEDAIKGERMKTELITNVSHDLKTPLTSIVSYVDLLRHVELDDERAKAYVDVLHDKSYRLKQLIEDLIEASKVSSGNISVTTMRIDYRQLVMQALGETEEKLMASGLELKINCEGPIYIAADGRHLWRVLENLVSNLAKYALPNSRVYLDLFIVEDRGVLVMKNISRTPIDFDETRLVERFVRGDTSRTTEGSGLGLSIAQSLTEAQNGTFGIKLDGDLFKVIVSMPLWVPDEEEEVEEEVKEENQE